MARGLIDGRRIVATAGTRVALSTTPAAFNSVTLTAETDNTGIVVVGAVATVIASLSTRAGIPLSAGDSITLTREEDRIGDLQQIGLDSTVSGDGVTFVYGAA